MLGVPTNVLEIVIYIAFIVWLVYRFRTKQKINLRLPLPVWAWVAVGLVAGAINPQILDGLGQWKALFFDPLLVYIMIINHPETSLKDVPRALVVTGIPYGLFGLIGFWGYQVASDGRFMGIFGFEPSASANFWALLISPLLVIAVWAVCEWQGRWRTIAFVSSMILLANAFGTGSRGVAIALVGGIAFAWIWVNFHKTKKWVGALAALLVGLCLVTLIFARPDLNASPTDGRVATSNNIRLYVWQTSIEMFKQKPILGVGLGNFQNTFKELTKDRVNYPEYISPYALTAHNLYLQILVVMGVVGFLVFAWWLYTILRQLSRAEITHERVLIVAALGAVLAFGLVDTPYFKNDLAVIWWILVAVLSSSVVYGKKESK